MATEEKSAAKAATADATIQGFKRTTAEVANARRTMARQERIRATEELKRAEALHSQAWWPLLEAVETAVMRCGGVTIMGATDAVRFLEVLEEQGFEVVEKETAHG